MRLAEKCGIPVLTFVDTPGAYPGGREERGQSGDRPNLYVMAELRVPIVVTIIGEGGSGGALAIAVGDMVLMLQYATYSVISPEGCASILWKSADKASDAAESLGITANRLKTLGLIDKIVTEPLGGAHRDPQAMMQTFGNALQDALKQVQGKPLEALLQERFTAHGLRQVQGSALAVSHGSRFSNAAGLRFERTRTWLVRGERRPART
jgi:acetyl-CoA carboxylase carboxyl transferase subunit alpha